MPQGPEGEPTDGRAEVVRHRQPLSRPEFLFRAGALAIMLSLGVGIGVHYGAQDGADKVDQAKTELGIKVDKATNGLDAATADVKDAQKVCKKLDQYGPELQAIADALRQDEAPSDGETTTTTTTARVGPPAPLTTTP